jgi:hypothetical protein
MPTWATVPVGRLGCGCSAAAAAAVVRGAFV